MQNMFHILDLSKQPLVATLSAFMTVLQTIGSILNKVVHNILPKPLPPRCFEKLLQGNIHPLQFAYSLNWTTDYTTPTALYHTISHLDRKDNYCHITVYTVNLNSASHTYW